MDISALKNPPFKWECLLLKPTRYCLEKEFRLCKNTQQFCIMIFWLYGVKDNCITTRAGAGAGVKESPSHQQTNK